MDKSKKLVLIYCGICIFLIIGTGVAFRIEKSGSNEIKQPVSIASVDGAPTTTVPSNPLGMQLPEEIPADMLAALEAEGLTIEDLGAMQGSGQMPAMPTQDSSQGTQSSQTPASSITHEEAHTVLDNLIKNTNGFSYMGEEDLQMANHYMHLLDDNPHDYESLVALGSLMLRYNDHTNSIGLLEHAQIVLPNDSRAPYHIGLWWLEHKDYEKAARNFTRSLSIKEEPEILYQLAILYRYNLNDEAKAQEYLAQAVANIDQANPVLKSLIASEANK